MNWGEGRARKHLPWGLPTGSQASSFWQAAAGCPRPPKSTRPGACIPADGQVAACSLFFPSVALGVQQLGMEGKEGCPPHVPLLRGDPDM